MIGEVGITEKKKGNGQIKLCLKKLDISGKELKKK